MIQQRGVNLKIVIASQARTVLKKQHKNENTYFTHLFTYLSEIWSRKSTHSAID